MAKRRLLVGGDSFAQFDPGDRQYAPYTHWCKRVADHVGMESINIAHAGHDLSTTVYSVVRELICGTAEYSHLIFFVTSFFRNTERQVPIHVDKINDVMYDITEEWQNKSLREVYRDNPLILSDLKPLSIHHCTDEEREKYGSKLNQFYYNDKLALLMYLKLLCDKRNMKIMLVDMFRNPLLTDSFITSIFDTYDISPVEEEHKFNRFEPGMGHYPSHFVDKNHNHIYDHFMKEKYEWIK